MLLKMYLANILIEAVEVDYEGLISCEEKQNYHEKIATELLKKHRGKMILSQDRKPVFYVSGVQSKMNNEKFKVLENEQPLLAV